MLKLKYEDFRRVEIRSGTIREVATFPEAREPAYKLYIDFGELGIKKSSAQITERYKPEILIGKQILAVVNFPPKQIGPFMSECLVLGIENSDNEVILLTTDAQVPDGQRVY